MVMTFARGILLGSAAGLCTVAAAEAADLPAGRSAPVEYVRVCSAHGNGFFFVPGTDTCLRIGGRTRFSYQYMSSRGESDIYGANRGQVGRDNSAFQTLVNLNFDARTSTSYGTLRTFIRVLAAYNTGGHMLSGTSQRMGQAYPALGQDTFGRAQSNIFLDRAFVQFTGFTAGRAISFFDFYSHDLEFIGATAGSNAASTNLLAYTATFGGGLSATISIEDPTSRRQPLFADTAAGSPITGSPNFSNVAGPFTQGVPLLTATGARVANYDVSQRELVPDVVAAIRYDASWGAAQISAAMHELRGGQLQSSAAITGFNGNGNLTTGAAETGLAGAAGLPSKIKEEIGWAVQGGLKVNLPQLATGDVLWLQAAYSEGAISYTGHPSRSFGQETLSNVYSGRFPISAVDSFIGTDGKQKLTEAWSVSGAFLHYWDAEWRTAFFGSYGEVSFGNRLAGPAGFVVAPGSTAATALSFNSLLRDYSISTVGANLIWSPVKDLDIGIEGLYSRVDLKSGRAADLSVANAAMQSVNGVPAKTVKYDDVWALRMRVQRDF